MRSTILGLLLFFLAFPFNARAVYFGGPILPFPCPYNQPGVCACFNGDARYVVLGPPRGGSYIWTSITRTYYAGPPGRVGQQLAGIASIPYYCVLSAFPTVIVPGLHMDMMGSSGPPAAPLTASTSPWQYPQFTTGAQYDAEVDRLESEYQACIANGQSPCNQRLLAVNIREERERRFGPRP